MFERQRVMTQVIESTRVPRRSTGLSGLLTRAAAFFRNDDRVIRPDALSRHTLRDIGLAEDARGNHLLGDPWLRR
ncbi:MAG TPA: hypothetical protein VG742_16915 [Dongiaceae bacterium]|nr:hypothetical protein [Dongiaceae bacterium]